MSKNRDLAEQYADLVCPHCGSSLDYDEDVVFCTDRDDCRWSETVTQIRKSGSLQLPSSEPGEDGQQDKDADDHVRVVNEKKKKAPDAPKKPKKPVKEEPLKMEEGPGDEVEGVHLVGNHSTPTPSVVPEPSEEPLDIDRIAMALSSYDPRVIKKICDAAIMMRQAMDLLSAAKGEI